MYMRDSLKIGITCYPTYGGSGVVATELGLELAQRGHDIHFISYAQPIRLDRPTAHIHYHEVEVSRYPLFDYPPYDLALATRMAEVSELYDLDLLHVHYAIPHSVSAMLARQMLAAGPKKRKLPFVTTLVVIGSLLLVWRRRPLEIFALAGGFGLVVLATHVAKAAIEGNCVPAPSLTGGRTNQMVGEVSRTGTPGAQSGAHE